MGFLQFAMYGVNVLFWMMGATMLGVGIWMAVDDEEAREAFAVAGLNDDMYWTSVYFMIATGAFVFIIAFIGMWGACNPKGNRWALYAYCGAIAFVVLMQLSILILSAIFWDSIDFNTENRMQEEVRTEYVSENSTDEVSVSWNEMQTDMKCCGAKNYEDYAGSEFELNEGRPVPWTCCVMKEEKQDYVVGDVLNVAQCKVDASQINLRQSDFLHVEGCYRRIQLHLEEHSAIIVGLTITFAILEVGGLVLGFMLLRHRD